MNADRKKPRVFILSIIVLVLGALMLAEGLLATVTGTSFMFFDNVHRGFEIFVGLITILIAAGLIDLTTT
jgi:hypothetical protein